MQGIRIEKGKWTFKLRRYPKSERAISTIMANLTMLVIVVFLSTLLFVWAVSSFGAYQSGAGYWFSSRSIANQERIAVENVFFTNPSIVQVYIRNVGTIEFTIASVYVNSTIRNLGQQVGVNQVVTVTLTGISWGADKVQTITVATLRGTTVTTTWIS